MKRDLSEFTNEEFEALAKEFEKEFREQIVNDWGSVFKTVKILEEKYEEHAKVYGEMLEFKYGWEVIAQILSWFAWMRFDWKYTIEEAKDTLGDALTISTSLDESIFQCFNEEGDYKEDLDYEASVHIFIDDVYKKIRDRGLKVYRRRRSKPRRVLPKEKIRSLSKEGYSLREIGAILNVAKSSVQRVLKE